jgi:hypothetical protein
MVRWLKRIAKILGVLVVLFGLIQLIPCGRTHSNPSSRVEPEWNSPRTRELVVRGCFDCHSNETKWPWYANVAPMSWVVEYDVEKAREIVNFSEWGKSQPLAPYSAHSVATGGMPPAKYRINHPEAEFTDEEKLELIRGLEVTLGEPK